MFKLIQSKSIVYLILVNLIFLTLLPANSSSNEISRWDESWSFSQEINIPIDTNADIAKYQPIDFRIEFDQACWAKNEHEHSIRVCCWDGDNWHELESQIYNLNHIDESHIGTCSLVFLIPEYANGKERYFVYYDDSEKPDPGYIDHVDIEESYYHYEPISGYPIESHYYAVIDDGYIVYAVVQDGQFMGYNTAQHVYKMKDRTTEVLPKNGDLFAAFDFKYCYDKGLFDYSSTSQHLVSKEILVNGNLMIEIGIVSQSNREDLRTTATYRYYHCPTSNTRIHTHVRHETLNEVRVYPEFPESNTDGTYASLQCGGVKSSSIKDLNFGAILPYMHVSDEMDNIVEYPIDTDPEYIPENPDIRVLSIKDDVDLGGNAWVSFDEGDIGTSHSVIFNSNSIVKSGTDERDGIQVNAFEMDYPHLLGIENNLATIQTGRNSYESGDTHDLIMPQDFVVEFEAEFFSSKTGGFTIVQQEVDIFQELVKIKPSSTEEFSDDSNETEKHILSVFVHLSSSMPFGSALSALLGANFSYINVELCRNEKFIGSGAALRLPMKPISELDELTFIEQISVTISSFDWRNMSFFKKISFQNLESGRYVIKIYGENPLFGKERKYIGFAALELNDSTKVHIPCSMEGALYVHVSDQNNEGVKNAEATLLKNDNVVAKNQTNEKGDTLIKAPCGTLEKYILKILYNGFMIHNDTIRLGCTTNIIPKIKSIAIERYSLKINIFDTWDMPLEVDVNPFLTSKEMSESALISANKPSLSSYTFSNLTPSLYHLNLKYKSYSLEKDIHLDSDTELDIDFPAEFQINIRILDSRGTSMGTEKIIISRNGKQLETQTKNSEITVSLPPSYYYTKIYDKDDLIGARNISVFSERNFEIITNHEPLFPIIVTLIAIFLMVISLAFSYVKRDKMYFLALLPISLVIIAVVSPWWTLYGSSSQLETSTQMFMIPTELVTMTTSPSIISGELASLPNIFRDTIGLIPVFTAIGCLLILLSIFFKKSNKEKLYFLSLISAMIVLIGLLLMFTIGMSMLSEIGVGSFIGEEDLDVSIPGEGTFSSMFCRWRPSTGFYLYVVATIFLSINVIFSISKKYFQGGEIKIWKRKR